MKQKRVLVLLATYNGEKYLREQIDSILKQKNVDITILASDDSSNDNTINILNEYKNRLKYVINKCGSAQKNFYKLINIADLDYDYYALSDQDDIWEEDKIYSAIKMLEKLPTEKPNLYSGVSIPIDEKKNEIAIKKYEHFCVNTLESAIIASNVQGCTIVFNKVFLTKIQNKETQTKIMHDSWLHKTCLVINGNVVFDDKPHMYYRQHENNVFSNLGKSTNIIKKFNSKLKKFFDGRQDFLRTELIKEWKENFKSELTKETENIFEEILNVNKSLKGKIKILFSKKFKSKYTKHYWKFVMLVIKGKI